MTLIFACVFYRMRVDDDSESSSSDSDEDEAGQQRQVNAQNNMLMPGQGMIP